MDLFLREDVPLEIKKCLAERIKEVGTMLNTTQVIVPRGTIPRASFPAYGGDVNLQQQAPSMQRIMERNPDLVPPPPITQAAVQAINQRQALIDARLNEKPEAGRTGPRKF